MVNKIYTKIKRENYPDISRTVEKKCDEAKP